MESEISKQAARRRRQRQKRKENTRENLLKESLAKVEENQPEKQETQAKPQEVMNKAPEKSREQILAERQAKKAKQSAKSPPAVAPVAQKTVTEPKSVEKIEKPVASTPLQPASKSEGFEKSKEQIHAEREAKKLAKLAAKKKTNVPAGTPEAAPQPSLPKTNQSAVSKPVLVQPKSDQQTKPVEHKSESKPSMIKTNSDVDLAAKMVNLHIVDNPSADTTKPVLSKAERRAIQEAQRAAKVKALEEKKTPAKKPSETPAKKVIKPSQPSATPLKNTSSITKNSNLHKVKLFKHLYSDKCDMNLNVNSKLHPAIIKLGLKYANDAVVGSNARCYAFLNAMKILINDYMTPPEKMFNRGLEGEIQTAVEFLHNCRPLAVSMTNALKYIKEKIMLETSSDSDDDKKQRLIDKIDTYAKEQIEMAAIAISLKVREKISNGDVILTYGGSSLIKRTLVEAWTQSELKFKVIVVDSRPDHEGQEMLKSLTMMGINCTYVLINAVSFVMPEVTKVLLGAHALLANGYVMSRVGTAQIAMVAKAYNVPVLICCETHKFSERVQTDAFVFNEIGDPNALMTDKNSRQTFEYLKDWEAITHLTPLNLRFDITPPELITAVVTEVAILPCTSVQVILRVKPAE